MNISWLETILSERLSRNLYITNIEGRLQIRNKGSEEVIIFDTLSDGLRKNCPDLSFTRWDARTEGWKSVMNSPLPAPGELRLPTPLIEQEGGNYVIHYDILGLTYWMLSRQEEIGRTDLDNHGRFPATSSHGYKYGYLERPIVDEWLYILAQVIECVWPQLRLKQHQFSMKVSHDVDSPSRYGFCSPKQLIRAIGADVVKRGEIKNALLAPWIWLNTKKNIHRHDPHNTFDWIMNVSELHGLTSAFYFISGGNSSHDADYKLDSPIIRALIRRIHERGHEIGLHPSYETYQNPERIVQEASYLREICKREGIEQQGFGGRMHFLRWQQPTTLYGWEQAGMTYDSTLGYADHVGFRCGTCFEYQAIDPLTQEQMNLRIRPLIVMESSVISKRYMGLGYSEDALRKILSLKETCQKLNGDFVMLWHNSHFTVLKDRIFYEKILS